MDNLFSALTLSDAAYLAYGTGGVGILMEWRAYWMPCGRAFRRWSAAGAVLWATQYVFLGAWSAGLTMASTALRSFVSGKLETGAYKHWVAAAFVALFAALTAVSWQGPVSLLPGFAVINTTLALFYLDNYRMRLVLLASSAAWITNDIYWQAWPALLAESVAMGINIKTVRTLRIDYSSTSHVYIDDPAPESQTV